MAAQDPVTAAWRDERSRPRNVRGDTRTQGQSDRDRILYASAFRRLGGVTQVVLAAEGHLFHNRLTHSLKVAQVGRRIAEAILAVTAGDVAARDAMLERGGLDPDVVEAACLAHDLGHPPFGHIGERALNNHATALELDDGFEGNAQSFRILTKLAVASADPPDPRSLAPGLDLTRGTLNAVLKYPWPMKENPKLGQYETEKWGAYETEREEFDWARKPLRDRHAKTLEADIMDWADDITYGVHDVEDFYRAGFIPLADLAREKPQAFPFLDRVRRAYVSYELGEPSEEELYNAVRATVTGFPGPTRFNGTRSERRALRQYTSALIGRYVGETTVTNGELDFPDNARLQVEVLKSLTSEFVVDDPALATQQAGEKRIIDELFETYWDALHEGNYNLFPARLREEVEFISEAGEAPDQLMYRFIADAIASMTEEEAVLTHQRLTGTSLGPLVQSPMK